MPTADYRPATAAPPSAPSPHQHAKKCNETRKVCATPQSQSHKCCQRLFLWRLAFASSSTAVAALMGVAFRMASMLCTFRLMPFKRAQPNFKAQVYCHMQWQPAAAAAADAAASCQLPASSCLQHESGIVIYATGAA